MTKTLPLTLMFSEGPCARLFLAAIRRAGWKPAHVLYLVQERHPISRRSAFPFLPDWLRRDVVAQTQTLAYLYWPRLIFRRHPELYRAILQACLAYHDDAADFFAEMLNPLPPDQYGDTFEKVFVDGYKDPRLERKVMTLKHNTILFTGGGIVPRSLLAIPGTRMIHIHPGYLPHVRGADGLLWSVLLNGKPAASCFFLEPGLDTGPILWRKEFEPVKIDAPKSPAIDSTMLYRSIFSFLDPFLRTVTLLELLQRACEAGGLDALPLLPQDRAEGTTFNFMHAKLRNAVLTKIFT